MDGFEISTEAFDGGIILHLVGAADIAAADKMVNIVARTTAQRPAKVIIDLAGVTDISSLFAGHLIGLQNSLKHHDGKGVICAAIPRVADALRRMRIHNLLPLVETVEAAKKA